MHKLKIKIQVLANILPTVINYDYFWIKSSFSRLKVFYAGVKYCTIEICRKIHFLHHWRALRHRYDEVLRRLADHRSNVRTNSSDYPCLVENEPACSFLSSLPALQVLPRTLLRAALPMNWWMFTKLTASFSRRLPLWSSATWSSAMSSPIEIVNRLNYVGYANSHLDTRSCTLILVPLAENAQWNCWKSNYCLSFLLIITRMIYTQAEEIRSDQELYAYSSNLTWIIIPEYMIHNSKSEHRRIALRERKNVSLYRRNHVSHGNLIARVADRLYYLSTRVYNRKMQE